MADVTSIMARLDRARNNTARLLDPVSREVRTVPVDPAAAVAWHPETTWVPLLDSLSVRLQAELGLSDEQKSTVEDVVSQMITDCAMYQPDDAALRDVLTHLVDRGFTVIPDVKR